MASFPTSIVSPTDPTATNTLNSPDHAGEHQSHNAEIVALETKIGTGSSTATAGKVLRATGTGTSGWGQVDPTTDVATLSSATLRSLLTDETGTGSAVFASTPTLITPVLGAATGTSLALGGGTALSTTNRTGTGNLVLASSPTIVTPTIASFTNAQHNHSNAAGGGVLTLPYGFAAYSTTAQNSGNAAFALTNFQVEEFDVGSNFASSTFTAPVTAYYHFDARVGTAAAYTTWIVSLYKNGSEFKRGNDLRAAGTGTGGIVSVTVKLTAADTVDIRTFGNAAIAIEVTQVSCYFQGYFLGA